MKTLTPQQIVDLNPCEGYDLQQVTELFDNKKSVTYLEILDTDKIPLEDIIWVFCRSGILSADIRNRWMEIIVARAVTNYVSNCGIEKVEKWAQNWLSGKDRTFNAAYAARDAARYAALDAAINARTVVYFAIYAINAAIYAAEDAVNATAAACAAAAYATLEIERKQQIQDLKELLQGESK